MHGEILDGRILEANQDHKDQTNASRSPPPFISGLLNRAPFRLEILFQNGQHMLTTSMTGMMPCTSGPDVSHQRSEGSGMHYCPRGWTDIGRSVTICAALDLGGTRSTVAHSVADGDTWRLMFVPCKVPNTDPTFSSFAERASKVRAALRQRLARSARLPSRQAGRTTDRVRQMRSLGPIPCYESHPAICAASPNIIRVARKRAAVAHATASNRAI
jgi:hypothetical protein